MIDCAEASRPVYIQTALPAAESAARQVRQLCENAGLVRALRRDTISRNATGRSTCHFAHCLLLSEGFIAIVVFKREKKNEEERKMKGKKLDRETKWKPEKKKNGGRGE